MPVAWNGPIVGAVMAYSTGVFGRRCPEYGQIAAEEALVMYAVGLPLLKLLPKSTSFEQAVEKLNMA